MLKWILATLTIVTTLGVGFVYQRTATLPILTQYMARSRYAMSFYPELDALKLNDLITRFHEKPLGGDEYSVVYFSEVASRIKQSGGDFNPARWGLANALDGYCR